MGYSIHLERSNGNAITIGELEAALAGNERVRIQKDPIEGVNPQTGQRIVMSQNPGDAEWFTGDEWVPVFRLGRRSISFESTSEFDDPKSDFRQMVHRLANALGAEVVVDEGVVYTAS